VNQKRVFATLFGLLAFSTAASAGTALADGLQPPPSAAPTATVPSPAMPPDLARHVQEITDAVLENHIDPPARHQMVLSGIKALYRAADMPDPLGLGWCVSTVTTPEQLAALLGEVWPKSTRKPVAVKALEDALREGLLAVVPGGAELMTAKDRNVAEQIAGNRYVGLHIRLGADVNEQRPVMSDIIKGGPAARAGIEAGAIIEEIDGADTKGMEMREVIDRLRGEEGTDVIVKVRQPKEAKARTMRITRGLLPRATIVGIREQAPGDWELRLNVLDPIGYLKITEITASTPHELRKLAQRMESEGIRSLVLDLRGQRPGGTAVHPAVLLADSLLERGVIGRVRTARGETTYQADADALFRGWPIAVLVDHDTSGTAEWLAAALHDNRRAVVVGGPTQGAQRRRGVYPGGPLIRIAGPQADGAIVKSTVPVGDGRWSISLATGYLERGDGRPLADRDGDVPRDSSNREQPRGGVQPDHSNPPFRGPALGASVDPPLNAAVTILHKALEKP
jgi:carboxyl-terminal processing protease